MLFANWINRLRARISKRNATCTLPETGLKWFTAQEIADMVVQLTVEELRVDIARVVPEAEIFPGGNLGASLDALELIMRCEEEFGIEIPEEDGEQYLTVGALTVYIQKKLGVY